MLRGNTLWTILRWKAHPRITLRLDGAHPPAGSHHQKIVVIDDCIAFCGGIDITMERWDTREHLDDDPRRVSPGGRPHDPWHDTTSAFDGAAARAIGDLARDRWNAATGETLPSCDECHDCWPETLTPSFADMRLAIARSIPRMDGVAAVHEIEAAYIDLIAGARRMIYAESQYFASRKIAHAIAKRLAGDDPPEIVLINPHSANGWLEPLAMDTARAKLVEALRRIDRHGRLRIYHPVTQGGADIYVHAKVMVVDDLVLRVGSSNFNNRSMRLDTECDVILSADEPGNEHLAEKIAALRDDLLAEHLGVTAADVAATLKETGSLIATVEALRGPGRGWCLIGSQSFPISRSGWPRTRSSIPTARMRYSSPRPGAGCSRGGSGCGAGSGARPGNNERPLPRFSDSERCPRRDRACRRWRRRRSARRSSRR